MSGFLLAPVLGQDLDVFYLISRALKHSSNL